MAMGVDRVTSFHRTIHRPASMLWHLIPACYGLDVCERAAMKVTASWDSQADKTYQIHASTDMETWTLALDDIAGNGERLTYCFVRQEREVFYRVELMK